MAVIYNYDTGQFEEDGGGNTPNIPNVTYGPDYPETHPLDAGGNPINPPAPDPSPAPTTTPPGPVTPFAGGMNEFMQMFGSPRTPAELVALEQRLNASGITIARNAAGVAGKIRLPNGQIIDVIKSADSGGNGFQWLEGGGSDSGGSGTGIDPSYLAPYTGTFNPGQDANLPQLPQRPNDFTYQGFNAPTGESILQDPSFQFRRDQGRDTIENSAAARGVLNSGGTLQNVLDYGQNFASQEYGNIWNRDFANWNQNYSHALDAWNANNAVTDELYQLGVGRSNQAYDRAWTQYQNESDLWFKNQSSPFSKIATLASIGAGASS